MRLNEAKATDGEEIGFNDRYFWKMDIKRTDVRMRGVILRAQTGECILLPVVGAVVIEPDRCSWL